MCQCTALNKLSVFSCISMLSVNGTLAVAASQHSDSHHIRDESKENTSYAISAPVSCRHVHNLIFPSHTPPYKKKLLRFIVSNRGGASATR